MLKYTDYKNIIKELKMYSIVIFYLLEQEKITKEDIQNIFYQDDIEKSTLFYLKIIKKITNQELAEAEEYLKNKYNRIRCIKDIIASSKQQFSHLETMSNFTLNNEESKAIIEEKNYEEYLRLKALYKLLTKTKIVNNLNNMEQYKKYTKEIEKLKIKNYLEFEKNISDYYINKIVH